MKPWNMDETVNQLERIEDLIGQLSGNDLTSYCRGLGLWCEGKYQPGATDEWKNTTRFEQAVQYIEWLEGTVF